MSLENVRYYKRKKYQRAMNKIIRDMNKDIKEDWLWNGRFVLTQTESYFFPYEDHSGGNFIARITCTDMKTGKKETKFFDNYNTVYYLFKWVNDCITQYWPVWEENPGPYEQAKAEGRHPHD